MFEYLYSHTFALIRSCRINTEIGCKGTANLFIVQTVILL